MYMEYYMIGSKKKCYFRGGGLGQHSKVSLVECAVGKWVYNKEL